MYKCPKCPHAIVYSDQWVAGTYSDGASGKLCRTCGSERIQVTEEKRVETPRINTYGCSPASRRDTH